MYVARLISTLISTLAHEHHNKVALGEGIILGRITAATSCGPAGAPNTHSALPLVSIRLSSWSMEVDEINVANEQKR